MPRFVVLEHAWEGTHWDLMLERGGVLATWSLVSPPPAEAGDEAEGRRNADHRLAYLAYEGPISRGRGAVTIWDRGTYEVVMWGEDAIEVRLDGARLRGTYLIESRGGAWVVSSRGPSAGR